MIISTNYITQMSHVDACLKPVIHQQSKKPGGDTPARLLNST